jgi:hypothetical protein
MKADAESLSRLRAELEQARIANGQKSSADIKCGDAGAVTPTPLNISSL